jgi:diphthine-ammonia ligase
MSFIASWSGGKDSTAALYRALSAGIEVSYLLNVISEDGRRSMSHGLDPGLIAAQAEAIGIPIVQVKASWDSYEADFKKTIRELKPSTSTGSGQAGIEGMVFGDIDLQEHRDWVERVCKELGIQPILPLWGLGRERILNDFINEGFEAIIVTVKADILGDEWLGRRVNIQFLEDLSTIKDEMGLDLCGENGEYHTFVTNGPLFKQRIEILSSQKVLRDKYGFLELLKYKIVDIRP